MSDKPEEKEYPRNWVTLYTDASWHPSDGLTSWAFWARHDGGRITSYGMCPDEIEDINQGEMYAIAQGMYRVLQKLEGIEGFYITTDSLAAKGYFENPDLGTDRDSAKDTRNPITLRLKKAFDDIVDRHELEIDLRHVKAHTGRDNTRSWLNDWCDKAASKAIREHRQKLKRNGEKDRS